MSSWEEDQDPYEILGLAQGHESTEAQIKKVRLNWVSESLQRRAREIFRAHVALWVPAGIQTTSFEETS